MKLKDLFNKLKVNKKYWFYLIVFLMTLIIIAGFFIPMEKEPTQPESTAKPANTKRQPVLQPPTGEKITTSGREVDNFYKLNPTINGRGDALISNTSTYQILYFSIEDQFLISIQDKNFESTRKVAEVDLLRILNIDEEAACKLNIIETTPNFVNPDKAGYNYQMIFCQK